MDDLVISVVVAVGMLVLLAMTNQQHRKAHDSLRHALDRTEARLLAEQELRHGMQAMLREQAETLRLTATNLAKSQHDHAPVVDALPTAHRRLTEHLREQLAYSGQTLTAQDAEAMAQQMLVESGL